MHWFLYPAYFLPTLVPYFQQAVVQGSTLDNPWAYPLPGPSVIPPSITHILGDYLYGEN